MKKIVLLIVFVCSSSLPGLGAERILTWEDCVKESRQNHPDLVSAREKLEQAQADKALTRSPALPQLNASASADKNKTEGRSQTESYAYGVSGRQLIFDGFKTSNDIAAAKENINSAQYNYQVVSSNVRLDLRAAFIGLLSAQENLIVSKDILDRRKQNLDLVTLRYQSGMEHKGSLLTAQANEAQAQLDHEQALRNVELYQRRLCKELGRASFVPLKVSGGLDIQDIDRTKPDFEKLVDTTPLLKNLAARKEAARLGVKSAKADFFPQVFADAGATRTGGGWPPDTNGWSAGITVSLPLFQGGQQQAALAKARSVYRQAQADERSGRDGVIFTLAQSWTEWLNNVDQSGVQEKFLEASKQRADIVEAQYTSGLASFNDWTIIEDNLVANQKALLQAKINALVAEASWRQAKGETLDE